MSKEEFLQWWILIKSPDLYLDNIDREIRRAEKAWEEIKKACQPTTKYQVD